MTKHQVVALGDVGASPIGLPIATKGGALVPQGHYPHEGNKRSLKASDGPWKGSVVSTYECCPEAIVEDRRTGRIVGRYVAVKVKQKTRTITKLHWDANYRPTWSERLAQRPAAEQFSRLRAAVLLCPCIVWTDHGRCDHVR